MMKKLLILLIVLACGVGQAGAETRRVFFNIDNSSWRENPAGMMIHIFDAGDGANTEWGTMPYLIRIGSSNWYYYDVNSNLSTAKFVLVTNSDKSWKSPNDGGHTIDFSKNNVVYMNNEFTPVVTVSNFDGYVVANSSREILATMTQDGRLLTGTLDFSNASSDVNFAVFPTFTQNEGGQEKLIWDVALRPQSANDYALNTFQNWNDNMEYGGNGKTWLEKEKLKYNVSFDMSTMKFTLAPYFTRTINTIGYSTFSSDYNVTIPGDVDVYYASDANGGTGKVTMTKKTNVVKANTGVLLYKSEGGEVRFTPASPTAADEASGNKLLPGGGTTVKSDASHDYYVLAKKAGGDICFSKLSESTGATVNKGKAYLQVSHGTFSSPSLSIFFDDAAGGTTAIDAVKSAEPAVTDGAYYNLAGQRVTNPTKGLYIVNGRKVVVK